MIPQEGDSRVNQAATVLLPRRVRRRRQFFPRQSHCIGASDWYISGLAVILDQYAKYGWDLR